MPKDELFPNSEGVYRKDVEANRQDEKISGVVQSKEDSFEIYSRLENKENKKDGKFKAETSAELAPELEKFKPNMEKVHDQMVDSHGYPRS